MKKSHLSFFQKAGLLLKIYTVYPDGWDFVKLTLKGQIHRVTITPATHPGVRAIRLQADHAIDDLLMVASNKDFQKSCEKEHTDPGVFASHVKACLLRGEMDALFTLTKRARMHHASWTSVTRKIMDIKADSNTGASLLLSFFKKQTLTHNGPEKSMDIALEAMRQDNQNLILWLWKEGLFEQIKRSPYFNIIPDVIADIDTSARHLFENMVHTPSAHKCLKWQENAQKLDKNPSEILWPKRAIDIEMDTSRNI